MLDNIADLVLAVSLLAAVFGFPTNFSLRYMVPGTAIGVFVGDFLFFWMTLSLMRRTGRDTITAMPLGLDTPSTFGMVFFVLGPAFIFAKNELKLPELEAARYTWYIGIGAIFLSGIFKLVCAAGSHWVRQMVPRAGLLGSLAAVALVLISFLPLVEIFHSPIVALISLSVILTTLVARVPLPFRIPGALGAFIIGGLMHFLLTQTGLLHATDASPINSAEALWPTEWLTVFRFEWVFHLKDTMKYMPIVIPFALCTVIGGIDCTESAAAAGDEFDTGQVIGIEAIATLVAALCGGVIQTTPYIGHPAYKAMGGRAGYVLATALFVGSAGVFGYFGFMYAFIPKATVFPILVFIGLEITAQSFQATPQKHYPALAIACVPALASLALIFLDKTLGELMPHNVTVAKLSAGFQQEIQVIRILANGFILTSLLWASWLAALIDRRLRVAAGYCLVAAICSFFGIMHSPLPGSAMFLPWEAPQPIAYQFAGGYLAVALLLSIWSIWTPPPKQLEQTNDSTTH